MTTYFLCKVEFSTIDEHSGKDKKIKSQFLVDSLSVTEAESKIVEYLKGTTMDYDVVSVSKSPIEDVIDHNTKKAYNVKKAEKVETE